MDAIKRRIVDECGGEISIRSDPGCYCEFEFSLPVAAQAVRPLRPERVEAS
jgi:signal transduction histidine kinase